MLDKGEYLGNFVICKENSTMNDDFSWTVYQNDKVRSLLNRSIALGKRLFCKIDQVGIHGAYAIDYRPAQHLNWVDDRDVLLQSNFWFRVGFPYDGVDDYVGKDEIEALEKAEDWDWRTTVTDDFLGCSDSLGFIKINGKTLDDIINDLNHQLEDTPFSLQLSDDKKSLCFDMSNERLKWDSVHINDGNKPLYMNYITVEMRFAFDTRDNKAPQNHILTQLTRISSCCFKWYVNIAYLKNNPEHKDRLAALTLREWKIPRIGHIETVTVDKMQKVPINDDSVFWYHPDFTFNNLNMNHFTGVFQNDKVMSYAHGEGPVYELVQLSATPKLEFFAFDETDRTKQMDKIVVYVPDFHISMSFFTTKDDFTAKEMEYNYLGNFVISLENTYVDRINNQIEVYQNDKVRSMLDRVHKKGKQLYAKLDQISFETTERADYFVEIREYAMRIDALGEPTIPTLRFKRTYRFTETYNEDADLWNFITLKLRSQSNVQPNNLYTFSYSDTNGVEIKVEGGEHNLRGEELNCFRIKFCANLQEDYALPRLIFDPRMSLGHNELANPSFIQIAEEQITDATHAKYGKTRYTVHFTAGAHNIRFTSNQIYFYHPDLIGDNCNLEPLTIACQYPGITQFHHPHYYYVRTLSAPTRIRFFHYIPKERVREVNNVKLDYYYEYEKADYVPAHFNVVISYYEGD